ncbi:MULTISPECIES: aminodeoxychorismate synthase component I [Sphingobium]|uniref:aminodeoxychorismate synthase component I n=1 Tax=Sphingobium TaxID=165695 RepID=UPI000DBB5B4C|nr:MULTISPECIES: aminodeoxychorismate synthase component I [Sphingobium]KAA9019198.1 aminodeoxychorismate synthase component I [Sphingobium limneticum]MBU0932946.1 aminodeoxychorismate synthase component I [Alphaproteobacteria bacterium]BBD01968.1 para-aminobenzoate synthetase/4-amino-4-deoxychorismate lyase [Sphingobium sp. YG1]
MRLPGPHEEFCLFDDARPRGAAARLYRDPVEVIAAQTMADVQPALDRLAEAREQGLHVAGYMAYEAGLALEDRLAPIAHARSHTGQDGAAGPLLWFGLFEGVRLIPSADLPGLLPDPSGATVGPLRPLVDEAAYAAAFGRVQDYIHAGDIYQVNLTFPCDVALSGDPMALYAAIRPRAAAGYGGVIRTGGQSILSFSPELFFTQVRGQLTARPMKGTATRAADPVEDEAQMRWLESDAKQRAENLMIVDLLRNDLSRVSQAGSVTVPDLFKVETYPTVHQLVSTVRARILPGLSPVDVLRILFPCGSITGAPKVRAMEIIDAVEPHPRGVYTGTMGWIDPEGDAAFNVAIRTLCVKEGAGVGRLGLGSGVVADSDCASEWAECLAKGRFLSLL